jgi:hypothetical protein
VLSVTGGAIELQRCWWPLNRDEPRGWVCIPLVDQEVLDCVDIGCIESWSIPSLRSGICYRKVSWYGYRSHDYFLVVCVGLSSRGWSLGSLDSLDSVDAVGSYRFAGSYDLGVVWDSDSYGHPVPQSISDTSLPIVMRIQILSTNLWWLQWLWTEGLQNLFRRFWSFRFWSR